MCDENRQCYVHILSEIAYIAGVGLSSVSYEGKVIPAVSWSVGALGSVMVAPIAVNEKNTRWQIVCYLDTGDRLRLSPAQVYVSRRDMSDCECVETMLSVQGYLDTHPRAWTLEEIERDVKLAQDAHAGMISAMSGPAVGDA